jgi:hypothetical protein
MEIKIEWYKLVWERKRKKKKKKEGKTMKIE